MAGLQALTASGADEQRTRAKSQLHTVSSSANHSLACDCSMRCAAVVVLCSIIWLTFACAVVFVAALRLQVSVQVF
jgi:hypothetical protein